MISKENSNNAFIKLEESAAGRVAVNLQKNHFAKDGTESYYGKVERFTYSTQNILADIAEEVPLVDLGTVTGILNAYTKCILKVLAAGNAVKFGELGTFYIAGKGAVDSKTGKPDLTVKFSPTLLLKQSIQNVEITHSEYTEPQGAVLSVTDIATGKTDNTVTRGGSLLLQGKGIKVGGDDSGIWFAPLIAEDKPDTDEGNWIKVESALIYNTQSKLLFTLPATLTADTKYRIIIRSRYSGKNSHLRKEIVETVSDILTTNSD